MTQLLATTRSASPFSSRAVLDGAARLWLAVAVAGQWGFFHYIVVFYGAPTLAGHFQAWKRNTMLNMSYVPGDLAGNLAFAGHVLLAGVIAFGGALQLLPWLRARWPALHRWNGRVFMLVAVGVALTGLYITWVRGDRGGPIGSAGISLNAVLILGCVAMGWRTALARDFASHRRWALRAYLVGNGQWFIRVGYVAVGILHREWMDSFFALWTFGCTLVPLAVLELYLRAQDEGAARAQWAVAGALLVATGLTAVGGAGLYAGMLLPLMRT